MEIIPLNGLLAPVLALIGAPFLLGSITKTKAYFAGRKGPSVFQLYYDIGKLLRKGAVYSTTTSWIFKSGPVVSIAALLTATCLVPFGMMGAPLSFNGDLLLFIYLLGVVRFFTVIAALDTGSAFEGMGASREVFFSALAEPAFLICLLSLSKPTHGLRLYEVFGGTTPVAAFSLVTAILAGASLFVILLAENARIPVDDPTTHLELTMIHEVMVLDHSGPDFAFINYGAAIKLWLTSLLVVRTLIPVHFASLPADIACTLAGMAVISILIGIVESVMARLRLLRVPQLLVGAAALAVLALLFGEGGLL
jgi:formate hydrogenlyase subunit 4